ncbi:ribulose-phosphate 3-epimerase [Pediococcus ethanolidurans]|uniref:ribulose-phosphate 3-epimerase n=1 Tax=Pediococcus ethanolidurans TaxID=319653 RepID=UPI001C1EA6DF|nr:ribulose-phosphate 3-epimerase [Pediococcus ethanolidurans]MBU7554520.1 ribulose-phosphate 3-epimerase [Pediococcus ethanolidurans]MBU7563095.1 ribulose-phosphate 3-epimerase [Pediococcus ethanolidurans]MCT4397183.1 ribulose-phosphate 3-epimerase [Pediococcus ethanolidurans]MCV3320855.1 ribulose-phosphate 3-epimerase [Pediococcus ethanolidurans]MCV3323512.1 ribulose-phosphate 3-epimerase [Pediococcus ethanolidurans]
MIKVAPSILSANFVDLKPDIELAQKGGADFLHIDVMDGQFVPNLSFGPGMVEAIRPITSIPLDCHLMIENPERFVTQFCQAGADIVGVHVESTPHIYRALEMIKQHGVKAEVVLNPGTPISLVEDVLPIVDQVLIMTVNPGFGGQKFISQMIPKIQRLNQLRQTGENNFAIEVDGGINDNNVASVYKAGADIAVAGSYVFNSDDPIAQIKKLKTRTSD